MADENAIADMLEAFKPGEGVTFEVLVDVWPEAQLKGPYTGLTVCGKSRRHLCAWPVDVLML
jgi:hypothetical protein